MTGRFRLPANTTASVAVALTIAGLALLVLAAFMVPVAGWNLVIGLVTAGIACLVLEYLSAERS